MANQDMAQYMGVFLDEACEQLELLEKSILALEHASSPELLQEIFRAAHTLKGSSRAMGFTGMGELTHVMEDVFDKLRKDQLTVSMPVIDVLFACLDRLKTQKDEIAASGESHTQAEDLTARLQAILNGAGDPTSESPQPLPSNSPTSAETPTMAQHSSQTGDDKSPESTLIHNPLTATAMMSARDACISGCAIYEIVIRVVEDCVMKSVRALMALQALETIGSILSTTPDEEAIENEEFGADFGIIFATENPPEKIGSLIGSISEITHVSWKRIDSEIAATEQSAVPTGATPPSAQMPEEIPPTVQTAIVSTEAPTSLSENRASEKEDASAKTGSGKPVTSQSQTIRVDVARLDKLLNLVGELVIDQTRIAQLAVSIDKQQNGGNPLVENLREAAGHVGRIGSELQEEIMKARMLPIDHVFNRFPRMIRDLAQKLGKDVEFVVVGQETELDRSVIEVIGDPLIHMLRNSVDHGLEMPEERMHVGKNRVGRVWLRARHEENHIVIEIEDDGCGMDPAKLKEIAVNRGILTSESAGRLSDKEAFGLIFESGFSTAKTVTDVSGRGVGMDIVRSNLSRLGALIDIDSSLGNGSKFTIKLPLTLAIIRGLLVTVANGVYVVPLSSILETIRIPASRIHVVNHQELILQRGSTLPLVRLKRLFYSAWEDDLQDDLIGNSEPLHYVVVVGVADRQVGLVVDSLVGEQEIVIKSLGKFVGDIRGVSGATILGDGHIALIVDVNGLLTIVSQEKVESYAI